MITLFLVACQIEFKQLDVKNIVTKHVEKTSRMGRTVEEMWVEQCVAKKEAGL